MAGTHNDQGLKPGEHVNKNVGPVLVAGPAASQEPQNEPGLYAKRQILLLGGRWGVNSIGGSIGSMRFNDRPEGWLSPYILGLNIFHAEDDRGADSGTMYSVVGGRGMLRRLPGKAWAPYFSGGISFGVESGVDTRVVIGFNLSQDLLYIPRKAPGLVFGVGLFQVVQINSEIYPWDVGVTAQIGLQF